MSEEKSAKCSGRVQRLALGAVVGCSLLFGGAVPALALPPLAATLVAFDDRDQWKEREKREAEREREYHKREAEREREYYKDLSERERERAKDARERAKERARWEKERYQGRRDRYRDDRYRDDRYRDDCYDRSGHYNGSRVRVRTLPTRQDRDGDGYSNRRDRYPRDPRRH